MTLVSLSIIWKETDACWAENKAKQVGFTYFLGLPRCKRSHMDTLKLQWLITLTFHRSIWSLSPKPPHLWLEALIIKLELRNWIKLFQELHSTIPFLHKRCKKRNLFLLRGADPFLFLNIMRKKKRNFLTLSTWEHMSFCNRTGADTSRNSSNEKRSGHPMNRRRRSLYQVCHLKS